MIDEAYDAEFTVVQKVEGKIRVLRNFLIGLYILVATAYVLVCTVVVRIPQVIAVLPILLWILIYFTWRYVHVEYKTIIYKGHIRFSRVLTQNNAEKVLLDIPIASAKRIIPALPGGKRRKRTARRIYDLRGQRSVPDAYCLIFEDEKKKKTAVLFRATRKMLRFFLQYNPGATVESDNLIY